MKFARPAIVDHVFSGFHVTSGNPCTVATTVQARIDQLVLGNGGAHTHNILQSDGTWLALPCVALPAAYNDNLSIVMDITNNRQVFVHIHTLALGAAGLTGITGVVEFQCPDYPNQWIPSLETVARTSAFAAHEFTLLGVGNWVMASRQEHAHYKKFRLRAHAAGATAADAATVILVSWYTDGGPSLIPDAVNV